ncbi:2'-5' RNA ligase superfamily protein [Raineyella antarctica]|uniref:2'-5' RNA ligase superfamily protein n=1 Tax=Raineyella antarctica TaxID=1577474 RepID=A0A1G6GLD0_9ACTN|nr:2'-5' RNA ligase family protein [Raineyella antarctica]SDB82787.1 2'-5' RNA ligase superfamily protein [Raineyella antarctica]
MSLAVCLLFDREGDRVIREIWARLESDGIPTLLTHTHRRHRPHLSYVVALRWDLAQVREALEALPAAGGFPLDFQGMLAFNRGRAALAASVTADVARRQEQVAEAVAGTGAELHHHYQRGSWLPHVSLATRAKESQLPLVARAVSDALPLRVRVVRAELINSGTGESWPISLIP